MKERIKAFFEKLSKPTVAALLWLGDGAFRRALVGVLTFALFRLFKIDIDADVINSILLFVMFVGLALLGLKKPQSE